jgi:adenine-specific DNA-methyltransferase
VSIEIVMSRRLTSGHSKTSVVDVALVAADPATTSAERKTRGAFFTPPAIAEYLARWAIAGNVGARVLDPTCGDGVFLMAAGHQLLGLGAVPDDLDPLVTGVDIHEGSLIASDDNLAEEGMTANLIASDFFRLSPPGSMFPSLAEPFDAVIGNPPFVRYQQHVGEARRISVQAALAQGVRLSGLASSWAALLVHAGGFVAPGGRLAMVLPAELLSVGYAEPVRRWLHQRFASVKLVVFERLQFADALENVVLLLAQGSGGCDAFSLYYVTDADDLLGIQPFEEWAVRIEDSGKWTDLFLSNQRRRLYRRTVDQHFVRLGDYGSPELGTVTGANAYFTMNEATRKEFDLRPGKDVIPTSPPGTRHFQGVSFTRGDWERLRDAGDRVWMLHPESEDATPGLVRYLALGTEQGVPLAYKCTVRANWWRPPAVSAPDLFFTYMSHRYPRLITNRAGVTFVNSMHGVRLRADHPSRALAREALPLIAFNSVTMLGAETGGRSYGGGILKMEPSEASGLPMPNPDLLAGAWAILRPERPKLDRQLREGRWTNVVARVDEVLLRDAAGMSADDVREVHNAAQELRARRLVRSTRQDGEASEGDRPTT